MQDVNSKKNKEKKRKIIEGPSNIGLKNYSTSCASQKGGGKKPWKELLVVQLRKCHFSDTIITAFSLSLQAFRIRRKSIVQVIF